MWLCETTRRSLSNIDLGTPQLQVQHIMLSQIIYVELNLAYDFDTSDGFISLTMITNHKQTCIIHSVDCRKALHSYFTHHTRKYFGCERRRGLHGGRHVVGRVDVFGTTCAAGRPLGLASGKLPSAHIASYEKGRCCQAPPCGETGPET